MNFIRKIIRFFGNASSSSCFSSNHEAAAVIKRLVDAECVENPYEWDDLYSIRNQNPQVNLALALCHYYENKFPSSATNEYCDEQGLVYFRKIANALENGRFEGMECETMIRRIRGGHIPNEIEKILNTS